MSEYPCEWCDGKGITDGKGEVHPCVFCDNDEMEDES